MSYSIYYHPEIRKDISSIPKNIKSRIQTAIEERLLVDPAKYGESLRRTLRGYCKLRVGDYRIIYRVRSRDIIILKIGHRKEAYQKERAEEI